eukprot:395657-Pleurochrysis_carterae.AAC.14
MNTGKWQQHEVLMLQSKVCLAKRRVLRNLRLREMQTLVYLLIIRWCRRSLHLESLWRSIHRALRRSMQVLLVSLQGPGAVRCVRFPAEPAPDPPAVAARAPPTASHEGCALAALAHGAALVRWRLCLKAAAAAARGAPPSLPLPDGRTAAAAERARRGRRPHRLDRYQLCRARGANA